MLKNEFEERTGLSMTEEEFNGVNALYMACGDDIDKDEFVLPMLPPGGSRDNIITEIHGGEI